MKSTQVTTWRHYTAAEKKAYRARVARRQQTAAFWRSRQEMIRHIERITGTNFIVQSAANHAAIAIHDFGTRLNGRGL